MLEIDGIAEKDVWFWDDIDPGPEADAAIDEIVGVEVPVADPVAIAALWHELLGLGAPAEPDTVEMGGSYVKFVPGGPSADWTVILRTSSTEAVDPGLAGISFRLV